ncbi:glycoside hydrolase family 172 protein [Amycolatopsis taiwanensis]|uniref:glycoside hydrolase family 172 protein n=1 Tax=Amycolatopsis taiwanensis TaxID=342230 RepID=UPI0004B93E1E|nr:glycoside hydrolase family 172 protein [Amycolatopsis taiwanensis]
MPNRSRAVPESRWIYLGIAVLTIFALAVPARAVAAPALPAPSADKGPVGWDTYRTLDAMERLRPGEQVRQFSSFDRTGGNDDGFNGTYSCLRHEPGGECVIAEAGGPGEISSMWFTYAAGSVAAVGQITVELDGRVVLQGSLQDIVNGAKGAPFVWPLVGNSADTMGGSVIKVPMPYTRSMKIVTQNNPHFYHVTYRQFADADGVRTFNPNDPATDVIQRLRGYGVRDPKPLAPGVRSQETGVTVAPGAVLSLPLPGGPRQVTELTLRLPQVATGPGLFDDGRAYNPGGSSFTAAIDPANQGVRVTRRYDAGIGDQRADVTVDGRPAGQWSSGPAVPGGAWADQTIDVPPPLTAGKSRIRIANAFASSSVDVNEFRYEVHSKIGGQWVLTDVLDVGNDHVTDESAHGYQISGQSWAGLRYFRYPADDAVLADAQAVLDGLRLRIIFDGRTTVDAGVGEFFGSGLGRYSTRTLLSSVDTVDNGAFTSWWPMPYARSATVQLVNTSGVPVSGGSLSVSSAPDGSVAGGLEDGSLGYFHATQHRADTVDGKDWNFLTAQGRGVFYGVTMSMRGLIPPGQNQLNFLEGDEREYADGSQSPQIHGTGTEDFAESGWYFQDARNGGIEGVPYAMPQAGLVSHQNAEAGCQYVCLNSYRLMLADAVAFGDGIEFDIEHGDRSTQPANYSSTAYWYGQNSPSLERSDVVDIGDTASRAGHGYLATGETTAPLTSTFEGKNDRTPVTMTTASSTGPVQFTARVDQANQGLRLRRISDQASSYQRANVYIDGERVGEWLQPLGNTHSRWLEDAFDVPASATRGKSTVTVRLEPVAGAPAWSAARYAVLSQVGPLTPVGGADTGSD